MLGLIRPTEGTRAAVRPRPDWRRVRALDGVAGFVEAPTFYPYLSGRRNLELLAAFDGGDARGRIDGGARHGRADRPGRATASAATRTGCASGSGSPPRCCATPGCCCSTSPRPASTPAGMRDMRLLIRRLADEGMTVLLSSHLLAEVEERLQPGGDRALGPDRLRGRDRRRSSAAPARPTGCATTDDERALAVCRAQPGVERRPRRARADRRSPPTRPSVAELSPGAGRGRRADPRAGAADGHARGPVLLAHRGRRRVGRSGAGGGARCARPSRPARQDARARGPASRTVYRWELLKLRYQKRTYLGLGRGGPRADHLRASRSTSATTGSGGDFAFASYLTTQRAGRAAGDPAVRRGVAVPADHRAGGRRHLRLRGPQRHAEDDPHPLARARPDLRRQGARRRHLRGRRDPARAAPWRWSPAASSPGFNPLQTPVGDDRVGAQGARSSCT